MLDSSVKYKLLYEFCKHPPSMSGGQSSLTIEASFSSQQTLYVVLAFSSTPAC